MHDLENMNGIHPGMCGGALLRTGIAAAVVLFHLLPVAGGEPAVLRGHTGWVGTAAFSRDGRHLVTGSSDRTARLWDAANGRQLALFDGHDDCVAAIAISPDGKWLATGCYDRSVRL